MSPGVPDQPREAVAQPLFRRDLQRVVVAQSVGNVVSDVGEPGQGAEERPAGRRAARPGDRLVQIKCVAQAPSQIADIGGLEQSRKGAISCSTVRLNCCA